MAQKTFINSASREIVGGRTLINGVGRNIVGGRTLINGVGYDVPLKEKIIIYNGGSGLVNGSIILGYIFPTQPSRMWVNNSLISAKFMDNSLLLTVYSLMGTDEHAGCAFIHGSILAGYKTAYVECICTNNTTAAVTLAIATKSTNSTDAYGNIESYSIAIDSQVSRTTNGILSLDLSNFNASNQGIYLFCNARLSSPATFNITKMWLES